MGVEDIDVGNTQDGGNSPDPIEGQHEEETQTSFDKRLDWLRYYAEQELHGNDGLPQPEKTKSPVQVKGSLEVHPTGTDPVVEMDRLIQERNKVMKECDDIEIRIVQSLNGFDFEQVPETTNRIAVAQIGELIRTLEKNDPGVETVTQARKRLTRLLELAELRKSYMLDVEEEVRHFIENE